MRRLSQQQQRKQPLVSNVAAMNRFILALYGTAAVLLAGCHAGGIRTTQGINTMPKPTESEEGASTTTATVLKEMDAMVARLGASLAEAKETRDQQLRSVMGEEQSQTVHTGAKKAILEDITKCRKDTKDRIAVNKKAQAEAKAQTISSNQIETWEQQSKNVIAHAAPFRKAYAQADSNFQRRYKHLSQVRVLIHNMTAQMNDFYVRNDHSSSSQTEMQNQPRFKSMLSQLSKLQTMVGAPVVAAEMSFDGIQNSTTAERTTLSNENHVTATERALNDVSQTTPTQVSARGHNVHVGSDVGGYVYLVLTRISATVSDELSSLKASFQLETATRKSVINQADENIRKLDGLIKNAKINNEKVHMELANLKEDLSELEVEESNCKQRIEVAQKSWIGSKSLGTNLHVTVKELTSQLDRQIKDIQHELQLATWVRKLMRQKLATMKKRASQDLEGASGDVPGEGLKVEDDNIETQDEACVGGGPKDWCSSPEKMTRCGVSKAACDAYLLQDRPDLEWPGHDKDQASLKT